MQKAVRICDLCAKETDEDNCKQEHWGILLVDKVIDESTDDFKMWDKRIDICPNCLKNLLENGKISATWKCDEFNFVFEYPFNCYVNYCPNCGYTKTCHELD
jgi:hypothetical protein